MTAQPDNTGADVEATVYAANKATAQRAHAEAAALWSRAIALAATGGSRSTDLLLGLARSAARAGHTAAAWRACSAVADLARFRADAAAMADAAVVLRGVYDFGLRAQIHELCTETLTLLGERDSVRANRVRAQLAATGSPSVGKRLIAIEEALPDVDNADSEGAFLTLHALQGQRVWVGYVDDRLLIADRAVELGRRHGNDEYLAWGLLWRLDAYSQLGRLVDVTAELAVLTAVVTRMREPLWEWRLTLVRAALLHLEGRFAEARIRADEAHRMADGSGDTAVAWMHLIMTSDIAVRTGEGLENAESAVRVILQDAPYFARGWLASILVAEDRRLEVELLWKTIRPHLANFPRHSVEWLIAAVGHAQIAVYLADRAAASDLYDDLLPFERMQAVAIAQTPSAGPVALYLGRLAVLLFETDAARHHFDTALALAEGLGSRHFAEEAASELARLRSLNGHVAQPGVTGEPAPRHPLTARETEVVSRVADGLRNRAIAERLFLSERTVENHVANALHKLGLASRSALTAWYLTGR
ncbi:DNA-binding CsgD family transcriptional regulator [Cryobacterium sp. CAN_C3]|uniref:response regulator transcription factor n=1 Tax=unclassified Cryobacterium TaxID=2649013 RepID=UPI0018CB57F9|nr:LuxR C-terminal-related transcriptional regulator [Cryobacterium sp. CAN_C3]MEC5155407.1 DNA-binding CsgD family transcriptional regulator [Cryobacterium sp. CAN_C3]